MIIDFIGAIATGFCLFGVLLLVNRLIGGRFGRWVYPAAVALGMIGYTVWAEYSWPIRTVEGSPQMQLASANEQSVVYRPWTYIWPQVTRLVLVDRSHTLVHPQAADLVLTQLVFIGRWEPIHVAGVVFDCAAAARVDLGDGVTLQEDGTVAGADWRALAADDPVLRAACEVAEEVRDGRGERA
ncbi:hypothetical protein [Pararhodobacter oceanensis]|uniref:hypothetical protein n=1 Tax=Pararhodobacter oceanensis TaxID=2172121 RepID=UPI003A914763